MTKWIFIALFIIVGCDKAQEKQTYSSFMTENPSPPQAVPYAMDSSPILIENVKIMTATGTTYQKAHLLMFKGLIQKVSEEKITPPENTKIIDATGMTMTPGLIDVHSHMGVYPSPGVDAHQDGNEMGRFITAEVSAEHAFWPQDPDLWRALDGGITTIQVLPGSGNLIGGRSFTAKLIPQLSAREMKFEGAPQGLKMACGENPKRSYRDKGLMTRMGNMAQYRKAFQEALEYKREWAEYRNKKNKNPKIPKRNFVSETLMQVMDGQILIHFHCYRADDISAILDLAQEFGFKIHTIHHGLEAYKVAERLAKEDVGVATWADWWGFKAEAYDGIPYNMALIEKSGGKAIIHSDSANEIRFLNIEAAKALISAQKLGLDFSEEQALAWVTKNAAWSLGVSDKIGTIEEGKMADLVLWDGHPFSIATKTNMVFINGQLMLDRRNKIIPQSDFEVGFETSVFNDGRDFLDSSEDPSNSPVEEQASATGENLFSLPESLTADQLTIKNPENLKNGLIIENTKAFIDGSWQDQQSVVLKNEKILAVNPKSDLYSDFARLDAQGHWLSPGLIETSSQLGLFEISLDSRAQDIFSSSPRPTPSYQAIDALNPQNIRIPIHREEGVTTVISSLDGDIAAGMGVVFDLDSKNPDARSSALFGSLEKKGWGQGPKKTRSALWAQLRTLTSETAYYLKNQKAFLSGNTHRFTFELSELKAFSSVLKGEVPWVIEAHRADDLKKIIALQKKLKSEGHKLRIIIRGGSDSWMVADELKANGIAVMVIPTDQTPTDFNKVHARFDLATVLNNKGVDLVISASDSNGGARLRQEAGVAHRYGLNPNEALLAITKTPARLFNLDSGEISINKKANLILWNGSPLEPTSRVEKLWIKGKEMSLDHRQKVLAIKYLNP